MEPSTHKINTHRLRPLCQRTSRTVMSILENGDISMEILGKPQPGNQEGSQIVQEMVHISGDGTKVQLYQNHHGTVSDDGKGGQSCWTLQEYIYPDLPPKQLKKYVHAYRFVELVKSRTPKIVLTTDRAKCKLMENSPTPDFQADFHDGISIQLSKRKVHVTDSDGNSNSSEVDSVSQSFPENILERFLYSKQCESECLRLVGSFNSLKTNGECPQLFPVSIGTTTSPVVIPLNQQTSSDSTALSNIPPPIFSEDHTLSPENSTYQTARAASIESPHIHNLSNSIMTQHIETLHSHVPNTLFVQQPLFNTSSVTSLQTNNNNMHENIYVQSQVKNEEEFHIPPEYNCSNLLNINDNNGANFPDTSSDVPQTYQRSSCTQPDSSCFPEFTSQVQSVSESYNKNKYCSNFGQNDQDEWESQQQHQEEFFPGHLDMSGLRVTGNKMHHQSQHVNPQPAVQEFFSSQQHANTQPHLGTSQHTTMHSFQSSPDISIHSQTFSSFSSLGDKRNIVVPSPLASSSGVMENVSPRIRTEIVDTVDNTSCFTPIQPGSVVASYPDPNPSQSPKKMQRKVLSLDLSTALENQMKSLDLSSSQSESVDGATPLSAGSEKYSYNTQNSLLKNTPRNISLNSTFSSGKISDRLRARQDQLNSSLPLSCDARHHGISIPQKQFLQSSDISLEQGHSEFGLPSQVRHSLDLSTSSNYSDSPSSSQSSSCEPLYQVFVPYTGWASYYASGAMWVLYNDGTQVGVKANEKTMTFIDQDGSQKKYNNKDVVPDIVKMKLEKFPSILNAVLNHQR